MKITFEPTKEQNIQGANTVEKSHMAARGAEKSHAPVREGADRARQSTGAYAANFGGQDKRAQAGIYKKDDMTEEKLSAEEISMRAEQMDADVQKMYMAVMSNSMSEEDFHKMLEDGYSVSDVDIETMVTILDEIKVAVAKGGGAIAGFTDRISKETLEQILGSAAYAEALESGLEEGAAAYMVENQMPPTAENIYKARYSAGAYQGEKKAGLPDRESDEGRAFWEQIDRVIEEAGLAKNEESREDAAFLLKHDIPLTEENLRLYEKLKEFEQGGPRIAEEELKYRIAMQAYEGKPAIQADLSKAESIYEQAVTFYEAVQEATPDAAQRAAANLPEGSKLTLGDILESERRSAEPDGKTAAAQVVEPDEGDAVREEQRSVGKKEPEMRAEAGDGTQSKELLAARRQLEEVRLRMSVEANVKLLRSGFQIDTAPMEQLIERLRAAEEAFAKQGILQTTEAVEKLAGLRTMPLATLGFVVSREISFTIEALHEKGSELQGEFERRDAEQVKRETANRRYETMQTEIRADLGDSIRKAFRNVDDILTDMNREPSEENRRAVRMLGYNQLELTEENLDRALQIDDKVQRLFRDMKPGKVLQMIRDGVDVLHTDIEELDAYLTAQSGNFLEESEDFARFLYKLDKNGAVTKEERENYIGIYRLVRQVEKSDGKAQGYLLGSKAGLTMENLLSAVRSGRKGAMDYRIDENFAGVDALQRGKSIIDQITALPYENRRDYEETMQALAGPDRKAKQAQREAADFLREVREPVTVSNLIEASSVIQEEAELYQRIEDYERETDREQRLEAEQSRFERYVENLQDAVTDEDSLQEGMEVFAKQAEEILREAETGEGVTEFAVRDMQHLYRGIRFRAAIARESRYQIPVKMESGYTVMNLTVRRGTGKAQAEISVETEEYGRLEAVFMQRKESKEGEESICGSFFAETEKGLELMENAAEKVNERLQNAGIPAEDMAVMRGTRVRRGAFSPQTEGAVSEGNAGQKEISTGELYQIAKIFLETVRNER